MREPQGSSTIFEFLDKVDDAIGKFLEFGEFAGRAFCIPGGSTASARAESFFVSRLVAHWGSAVSTKIRIGNFAHKVAVGCRMSQNVLRRLENPFLRNCEG